jgi:bifunctional enzyme CysN/CysC
LYAKAMAGEIADFTGISSPYEPPLRPDLRFDTSLLDAAAAADQAMELLLPLVRRAVAR